MGLMTCIGCSAGALNMCVLHLKAQQHDVAIDGGMSANAVHAAYLTFVFA